MTDTNKLKELAERHVRQIAGFGPDGIIYTNDFKVDAKKVLALIAEVERLRTRLEISDKHPYDGIDTRNATIEGLERLIQGRWKQEVERLEAENEALRKLLDSGRYYIPENKIELLGLIDAALEGGGNG